MRCHLGRGEATVIGKAVVSKCQSVIVRSGRMSSTSSSLLLLLILTLSYTTTAVSIEPKEADVKGDPFLVSTDVMLRQYVVTTPPCDVVLFSR